MEQLDRAAGHSQVDLRPDQAVRHRIIIILLPRQMEI
jgi:hypothetical protein